MLVVTSSSSFHVIKATDVTPDPVLYRHLASIPSKMIATSTMSQIPNDISFELSKEKSRILDFFINLAICNTVVLSNEDHNQKPEVDVSLLKYLLVDSSL